MLVDNRIIIKFLLLLSLATSGQPSLHFYCVNRNFFSFLFLFWAHATSRNSCYPQVPQYNNNIYLIFNSEYHRKTERKKEKKKMKIKEKVGLGT